MWVKGSGDEEGLRELDETKHTHGVHKEARRVCLTEFNVTGWGNFSEGGDSPLNLKILRESVRNHPRNRVKEAENGGCDFF